MKLLPKPWLAAVPVLLVLLLVLTAAPAQHERTPPRSVSGVVRDHGGEPLRGAVVQIEAEDTLVIQSYDTDEHGQYHFRNLRPDADFHVWASFRGHHSKHHELSKLDHKGDRVVDLVIDLTRD